MVEASSQITTEAKALTAHTQPGNYFVSNYPPFEKWCAKTNSVYLGKLDNSNQAHAPLGVYFHIPFCRKRCNFCYFKVYTDKDSGEIDRYINALIKELKLYSEKASIQSRAIDFIYFGGGTPSYLSISQLQLISEQSQKIISWDNAKEISFEAEPGTLNSEKLSALKRIGVTRLSLGVESFSDHVLTTSNRSHELKHILSSYAKARELGFAQINIDLIAGLQGETDASWDESIKKTIELAPDSVTIYQLEVPFNTILYKEMQAAQSQDLQLHDWDTKAEWIRLAFQALVQAGYTLTSAYTAVKNPVTHQFLYRNALWHGADLLALGVASFGHISGSLYQNEKEFSRYISMIEADLLPVHRTYELSREEAMIRQLVLQCKLGRVSSDYFATEFGVELESLFKVQLDTLKNQEFIKIEDRYIVVENKGLLKVDEWLKIFYLPQHKTTNIQNNATQSW